MSKKLVIVGLVVGVLLGAYYKHSVLTRPLRNQSPPIQNAIYYPPQKIKIPNIGVEADIEEVGMDSKGNMDVPSVPENTAWFKLGYTPGEKGAAVIDGHFDTKTGAPGVFYSLSKLKKGDAILITDTTGKTVEFTVSDIQSYEFNKLPMTSIFGAATVPSLNLITCDGVFDGTAKNYSKRLVVYSTLSQK